MLTFPLFSFQDFIFFLNFLLIYFARHSLEEKKMPVLFAILKNDPTVASCEPTLCQIELTAPYAPQNKKKKNDAWIIRQEQ